ncbi:hypothetical protein K7432_005723 [Basidiobolus ranarum]|uniref:Aminoglycoside phosphotransferase domain-containing protein n=1 Tax=Basidiobolus ranarum TaxID=34480 RepID=A0ABR2WW95_9FUNG
MGYTLIPGIPLSFEAIQAEGSMKMLAEQLAQFLAELHDFPTTSIARTTTSLSEFDPARRRQQWQQMYKDVYSTLEIHLTPTEFQRICQWWDTVLQDTSMNDFVSSLIHGDFWYENILVSSKELPSIVGVIDFEAAEIADPAQDLAVVQYLGIEFQTRVLNSYRRHRGMDEKP